MNKAAATLKRLTASIGMATGIVAASAFAVPVSHATTVQVGPGDSIVIKEGAEYYPCTLGPYVVINGTQFGALTAGHCGKDGDLVYATATPQCRSESCVYSEPVGTFYRPFEGKGNVDNTFGYDYALVKLDRSVMTDDGRINGVKIDGALGIEAVSKLVGTHSDRTEVCSIGLTSGYRCGTLVSVTLKGGRIHLKMFSQKGDSGGPVWANVNGEPKLIGTVLGGAGERSSEDTYVSPLDKPVTDYGILYLNSYG